MLITLENGVFRVELELDEERAWALAEITARVRLDQLEQLTRNQYDALDALNKLDAGLRAVGINVR